MYVVLYHEMLLNVDGGERSGNQSDVEIIPKLEILFKSNEREQAEKTRAQLVTSGKYDNEDIKFLRVALVMPEVEAQVQVEKIYYGYQNQFGISYPAGYSADSLCYLVTPTKEGDNYVALMHAQEKDKGTC